MKIEGCNITNEEIFKRKIPKFIIESKAKDIQAQLLDMTFEEFLEFVVFIDKVKFLKMLWRYMLVV